MFIGRDRELATLESRYSTGRFECVVIYGRRRVGKTALINRFCKNKRTVYYQALESLWLSIACWRIELTDASARAR